MTKNIKEILLDLFKSSKEYDNLSEWEFIQTIMRDKYSCNAYTPSQVISYDDIYKTIDEQEKYEKFQRQILDENISFINSLIKIGNNVEDYKDVIRLRLISYSYITETKYIQNVIANLLWIAMGKSFYVDPFAGNIIINNFSKEDQQEILKILNISNLKDKSLIKTDRRIKFICYLCQKANKLELMNYIQSFYDNHLRNSIYHSKYIFSNEGYIGFDNSITIKLSIDELSSKIDNCIYFYINLINLIESSCKEYKETKKIKGRKPNYDSNNYLIEYDVVDVTVIANKRVGIVSTLCCWKNTNNTEKESNDCDDDFMTKFIEFTENYDILQIDDYNNEKETNGN